MVLVAPAGRPPRRVARLVALGSLVLAVGLAPACGGPSPSVEAFLDDAQEAACARLVECAEVPDVVTCKARGLGQLGGEIGGLPPCLEAAVDLGNFFYHPEHAEACVAALRHGRCTFGARRPDGGAACDAVLTGHIGTEGSCNVSGQCVEGTACVANLPPDVGSSCQVLPGEGEHCTGACAPDLRCIAGTCAAGVARGAPCVAGGCAEGLWCASSRCASLPVLGDSCDPMATDGPCQDGWCDPVSHQCVPLPGVGEDCTSDGVCGGDAFCNGGQCAAFPAEHQPCLREAAQTPCALGLSCKHDLCTRPEAVECP